jgi:hypothetical protein
MLLGKTILDGDAAFVLAKVMAAPLRSITQLWRGAVRAWRRARACLVRATRQRLDLGLTTYGKAVLAKASAMDKAMLFVLRHADAACN